MQSMNPSEMTSAQMGKISDLLTASLRKAGLQSEPTQVVIETQGKSLVEELVGVIRKRIEAVGNLIVRRVKVNRNCTPKQVLDATGRKQYTDSGVVATMPHGEGDEVEVVFFKPDLTNRNGFISDADLDKEYELRGLKPTDPYSVAAVNEADSSLADEKPHGTHWKDADGKWCFVSFRRWGGERYVRVNRLADDWRDFWWFAGIRK